MGVTGIESPITSLIHIATLRLFFATRLEFSPVIVALLHEGKQQPSKFAARQNNAPQRGWRGLTYPASRLTQGSEYSVKEKPTMLKLRFMLFALAAVMTLSTLVTTANAQCSNANVNRAIQEVTGRAPYRDAQWNECNLVGNVSNMSYVAIVNDVKAAGLCTDPWITKAYFQMSPARIPAGWGTKDECSIKLYNNGTWGSYSQLSTYVFNYFTDINQTRNKFMTVVKPGKNPNVDANPFAVIGVEASTNSARFDNKVEKEVTRETLVGNDGASLVAAGGGNLVAAGGGNVVPTGGGGLISNAPSSFAAVRVPQYLPKATNAKSIRGGLRIRF